MERLGVNWTDLEVQEFIAGCYDRDALLNVLLGYGSQWLEGRLVCVVTKASVQPFLARGWSSWGDDEETTDEFAKVSVPVKGSVTLRAVVEQGIPTVGRPEKLGLDALFEETSVLAPDKVAMIPLQMGGKTKMLLIGEPRVSTQDLDAFSDDISPLFVIAENVTDQLEELILLAKTRKLPPRDERVPAPPTSVIERLDREDMRSAALQSIAEMTLSEPGPSEPTGDGSASIDEVSEVSEDDLHTPPLAEVSRTDLDGYFGESANESRPTLKLNRRKTSQIGPITGPTADESARKTLPIDIRGKQSTARDLQAIQAKEQISTTQSGAPVSVDDEVLRAEQALLKPSPLDVHGLPSTPFDESSVADLEPDSWASAVESSRRKQPESRQPIAPKRTLKIERDAIRDKLRQHMEKSASLPPTSRPPLTPSAALDQGAIPISPRPLKTDPDVPQDVEEDGEDVAIIQPIGIGMENPVGRQTLMGGFSMDDLKRAHDAQAGGTRITMQGISVVKDGARPNEESEGIAPAHEVAEEQTPIAPSEASSLEAEKDGSAQEAAAPEPSTPVLQNDPDEDLKFSDEPSPPRATLIAFKADDGSLGEVVSFAEAIERISEADQISGENSEPIEDEISTPILDALSQVSEPTPEDSSPDNVSQEEEPSEEPAPVKTLAGVAVPIKRPVAASPVLESDPAEIEIADADDVPSIAPEFIELVEVEPLSPEEFPSTDTVRLESISGAAKDLALQRARSEARSEPIEELPEPVAQPDPAPSRPSVNPDQIKKLMEVLDGRDRAAAFALASKIEGAPELVPHLMESFPGRLYVDRYQWPVEKLASVEDHGPVLRALVNLGDYAAPAVARLLDDSSLDVRFYATYMFTKIPSAGALEALYERLDDRDRQTRAVAVKAMARAKGSHDFTPIRTRILDELTTSNDTSRVEAAANLLGLVHSVEAIPVLINTLERHGHRTGLVIHQALQHITLQSLPQSTIAWRTWWNGASGESRSAWVLRAMNAPADDIRTMVAAEIARLRDVHINYHPDQPPSLRTRAQGHLKTWLDQNPHALD